MSEKKIKLNLFFYNLVIRTTQRNMASPDTQNELEKLKETWHSAAQMLPNVKRIDEIVYLRVKLFEESRLRREAEESTQLALTCGLGAQDRCDAKDKEIQALNEKYKRLEQSSAKKDEFIKKLTDQLNSYLTFCDCRHHTPLPKID